jgi:hypothetical protein
MKAKDSIEHVLDRLSDFREELLSLERELERVEAMRRDDSGEPALLPPSAWRLLIAPKTRFKNSLTDSSNLALCHKKAWRAAL